MSAEDLLAGFLYAAAEITRWQIQRARHRVPVELWNALPGLYRRAHGFPP